MTSRYIVVATGVLLVVSASCDGSDANDAPPSTGAAPTSTSASASGGFGAGGASASTGAGAAGGTGGAPPSTGVVDVTGCSGIDGISQLCSWHYSFDPTQCSTASPCDKLVAFYAGGGQDCASYDNIVQAFVTAGYITACIQLFEDSDGAGMEPYVDEAPRVDATLQSLTGSPITQAVWSGNDLLISGVSHGATAPVIAMARTSFDDAAHWHGARKTAGCFYDGIYDIGAIDQLLGTGDAGSQCVLPVSHSRIIGRYYPTAPLLHACSNDKCFCDPDHNPKMDQDSITAVAPTSFAITRFKLIECGSAMDPCTGDIVPKAPIDALCNAIDADPTHSCVLDPMPNHSHVACAPAGTDKCITWFDALPPD